MADREKVLSICAVNAGLAHLDAHGLLRRPSGAVPHVQHCSRARDRVQVSAQPAQQRRRRRVHALQRSRLVRADLPQTDAAWQESRPFVPISDILCRVKQCV